MWWSGWKSTKSCLVCAEKDRRIAGFLEDVAALRQQLAYSREREARAVDTLLQGQGVTAITPPSRMMASESEKLMEETFAFFKDLSDPGDGTIQEADRLTAE